MGHAKHSCPQLKRKSDKHRRGKVAGVITSETNLSTETNVGKTREMIGQAISNVGCSTLANNTIAASVLSTSPGTESPDLIVDSGVFNHMTSDETVFYSLNFVPYIHSIQTSYFIIRIRTVSKKPPCHNFLIFSC
ncbi:hypothetical protein NC652_032291 [Populus alba x Populus x berolinensis]|nr:hypothetical protein NC652_032291 [Populus alba x Populus x berolinensis]